MVKVDVLAQVKQAQSVNGIRHSDYLRYRRFCCRKMRRLRAAARFTYGRGRTFEKRQFSPEECAEPKVTALLLFNAERAWSSAMQLRQHLMLKPSSHTRNHLLRRLRKAVKWSERLHAVTSADTKTNLEASAYHSIMCAYLELELKHAEQAHLHLQQAKTVLERLRDVSDSLEAVKYADKLQSIAPMLSLCRSLLHHSVSDSELLQLKFSSNADELITAQIEALLAEGRQQRLEAAGDVEIYGKRFTIKNEKAREALRKAEEAASAMEQASDRLEVYTVMFSHYDEAARLIKKEKDEKQAQGEVSEAELWGQVLQSVLELKKAKVVERNLELARQAEQKFEDDSDTVFRGGKARPGRLNDIIKIYDTVLASVRAVDDTVQELELRGKRAYYVSLSLLYSERYLESYALLQRCEELHYTPPQVVKLMVKLKAFLHANTNVPDIGGLSLSGKEEDFPPRLEPLPPKPVFFDLAWDSIQYPDLTSRFKSQAKGLLSRLFWR